MSTIKEIAKSLNLSTSTVSRILNYDKNFKVSEETKAKVFKQSEKLGYIKKLRKNNSYYKHYKVAIIHWYTADKEISDPFYLSIRIGVENYLSKNNIEILRFFKNQSELINTVEDLDGIICIGKFSTNEINSFRKICNNIVFIDMFTEKIFVTTITLDLENAINDMLDYLISLGHSKIGFLGGKEYTDDGYYKDKRIIQFRKICKKYNILNEDFIIEDKYSIDSGYNMMLSLIKNNNLPTAIFCANDLIAQGVMHAAFQNNIKIPDDLSIIGFNNDEISKIVNPKLTTINAPSQKMGEYGAMILKSFIEEKKAYPINLTLPCEIVIRESCIKKGN